MRELTDEAEKAYHCFVSHLDNPMFVLTVASEHGRAGCLIGFATQCSIHPPRWYVGVSKLNHTFEIAAEASLAVVHALGTGNLALASLFGEQTGDEVDKFSLCEWHPGPDGRSVVLTDCERWFAGKIVDRFDPGDHIGLVLSPVAAECWDHGPQLGFQAVRDLSPGHPA
jgi:flavin reductase (DIM6/NTAB) family NADH-FMN oxidoreductase RutF